MEVRLFLADSSTWRKGFSTRSEMVVYTYG